jgi:hypothetical protein
MRLSLTLVLLAAVCCQVGAEARDLFAFETHWSRTTKTCMHLGLSGAAAYSAGLGLTLIKPQMPLVKRSVAAVGIGIVPGIVKESLDHWVDRYDFNFEDIITDVLGAVAGGGLFYLVHYYREGKEQVSLSIGPHRVALCWNF